MAKRNGWSNQGRFDGKSGLISMGLAVFLSVSSVAVGAQTVFEFEDPLAQTREKIERANTDGTATPSPVFKSDQVSSTANLGPTTDVKGPITVFAERLGLTTAGLIGLCFLALLALGLGLMWLLGRREAKRVSQRTDRELYALSDGARGRRMLESGAKVTRNRKKFLDTTEEGELTSKPSAARKAAKILSTQPEEELELGQEDQIDDDDAYMLAYEAAPDRSSPAKPAAAADPGDPDTWKRPNLDRLKASIKDDWTSKDEKPLDPEAEELRKEAEVFADLFSDEKPAAPAGAVMAAEPATASKSPAMDMLDNGSEKDEPLPVASLHSAVEQMADVQARKNTGRSDKPDRSDALRRIRALRESVKAS